MHHLMSVSPRALASAGSKAALAKARGETGASHRMARAREIPPHPYPPPPAKPGGEGSEWRRFFTAYNTQTMTAAAMSIAYDTQRLRTCQGACGGSSTP